MFLGVYGYYIIYNYWGNNTMKNDGGGVNGERTIGDNERMVWSRFLFGRLCNN